MKEIIDNIIIEITDIENETLLLFIYKYICALKRHSKHP